MCLMFGIMEVAKAREDNLRAVWFAAGAAVAVACLQRAGVAALVEQWRMWMFVALNLLLLAILFTSTSTTTTTTTTSSAVEVGRGESNTGNGDKREGQKLEESRRKRWKARRCGNKLPKKMNSDNAGSGCREDVEEVIVEDDEDEDGRANGLMCLSKEELNERVEAFIAMFRQQLISDAKNRSMGFHSTASAYNTGQRSSSSSFSCLKN